MSVSRKITDATIDKGLTSQVIKEGEVVESQSWEGSLEQMQAIFDQEKFNWQVIRATRNGPNWQLTGERTIIADENAPHPRQNEETIEVIWREVMIPLRQSEAIQNYLQSGGLVAELDVYEIEEAQRNGTLRDHFNNSDPLLAEFALNMAKSPDFPTAVPVVRRTLSFQNKNTNRLGLGQAYVRDNPPIQVPGPWEWLKTTDERRRTGATYTQVEEWTGSIGLSTLIYPE